MTYTEDNINTSVEVLIDLTKCRSLFEMLDRITQIRATGRYSDIHISSRCNAVVGVMA